MNAIKKFLAARGSDLLWGGAVTTFLLAAGVWTTASSVEKKSRAGVELAEREHKAPAAAASPTPVDSAKKDPKKEAKKGGRGKGKPTEVAAAPSPSNGLPLEMEDLLREKPVFGRAEISVNVQAVFGEVALINGAWIKVGQEHGGIKVVEFSGDKVILEIYGERVEKAIWDQPATKGPAKGFRRKEGPTPVGESAGGGGPRGGGWGGGQGGQGGGPGGNRELREGIRQKLKSGEMSRDDVNKMYRNSQKGGGRGKAR